MNEDAVALWIRRAENDLKTGKDELATEEPATDTVCFHMQQCCEKYLKAFLMPCCKDSEMIHTRPHTTQNTLPPNGGCCTPNPSPAPPATATTACANEPDPQTCALSPNEPSRTAIADHTPHPNAPYSPTPHEPREPHPLNSLHDEWVE